MPSKNANNRPRPYHHGNLREGLIDAALALLEREGEAITIRAVAKSLGVSHAAPYNHFADKEALLAAVAIRGFETLRTRVEAARAAETGDAGDELIAAGLAYVLFAAEKPALFRLMFGPRKAAARADDIQTAAAAAYDALVDIIRPGCENGSFRPIDPETAAFAAWSLVHGMAQLAIDRSGSLTPEDRDGIAARLQASHAIMMGGLRPR
jgi:AcrR family transcriptional regulator